MELLPDMLIHIADILLRPYPAVLPCTAPGMSAPRADFHMDGQTLSALSAASTAHWRLAGHLSLRYQVLWIIREHHGAQATYAFTPTEWADRSFKADGK